jgi:alpha-tubulin suppressor-like RCC1 family protein
MGANEGGQLGVGDTEPECRPTSVSSLTAKNICQLAAGSVHSAALSGNSFSRLLAHF